MFVFAILLGIYSYLVFSLGILGVLYREVLQIITIIFISVIFLFHGRRLLYSFQLKEIVNIRITKTTWIVTSLLIILVMVNLIGALGPELAFDALWYHLTLPKMYLDQHAITFIPGGLLYYSAMPKLTEMLYTATLAFHSEIIAKVMHFGFGILTCIALYLLSRRFFSQSKSLLVVLVFYSNLVVAWESITAYIDLTRTFFEVLALWSFILWYQTRKEKWVIVSSLMVGFVIVTKLLAVGSLVIFLTLLAYELLLRHRNPLSFLRLSGIIIVCALLIPLPWLVFSYLHTGNPVYPFFTSIYPTGLATNILSPIDFITDTWIVFTQASDPISPIYLIVLPLLVYYRKRLDKNLHMILLYSLLAVIVWYLTPRTGGGRFLLPYLPAFSLLVGGVYAVTNKYIQKLILLFVFFIAVLTIVYRGTANTKYFPVIIGQQSSSLFLTSHLNFEFGDFYDTDEYFAKNINKNEVVLLYGFHNLYYVDFPYIHSSWVKKGDKFTHIATQHGQLPERFKKWELIYENSLTGVRLYSLGGKEWRY